MPIGFKHRKWEVFVSVSASGPESSKVFERNGRLLRTRMAADLDYTTADVDYFYDHFTTPELDQLRKEDKHIRLVNPSREAVLKGLTDAMVWLGAFRDHPDWDGGGLHFNYAGHGAEPDGALVLRGERLSIDDFLNHIEPLAAKFAPPGRLRLSVVLDSCHSGYWITRILDSCLHERSKNLIPFNLFASCMYDEVALEDSSLGHGLYTYCFSVQSDSIGSYGAKAVLPNNCFGPSLSVAAGEYGCSLLSAGGQNPVSYWNGAGQLEVSESSFLIEASSGELIRESEMNTTLVQLRDEVRAITGNARPDFVMNYNVNEGSARHEIKELREKLEVSESNKL